MSSPLADKFFTTSATCLVTIQIELLLVLCLEVLILGNRVPPNNVLGSKPMLGTCIWENTVQENRALWRCIQLENNLLAQSQKCLLSWGAGTANQIACEVFFRRDFLRDLTLLGPYHCGNSSSFHENSFREYLPRSLFLLLKGIGHSEHWRWAAFLGDWKRGSTGSFHHNSKRVRQSLNRGEGSHFRALWPPHV